MKNKNENSLMLLTGFVAGAAVVYFLKSEKGQQMVDLALSKGEHLKSSIADTSKNLIEDGKSALNKAVDSGESLLKETKENALTAAEKLKKQAKTMKEEVKDKVEEELSDFQKGVEKAKKELNKA